MLINTHMLMGRKIYENMDYDKKALISPCDSKLSVYKIDEN